MIIIIMIIIMITIKMIMIAIVKVIIVIRPVEINKILGGAKFIKKGWPKKFVRLKSFKMRRNTS